VQYAIQVAQSSIAGDALTKLDFDRRALAKKHLKDNELPVTVTSFPRLGVPGVFTDPYYEPENALASHSLFLPDEITNPHARFPFVINPNT
jgi:hypothetical protein